MSRNLWPVVERQGHDTKPTQSLWDKGAMARRQMAGRQIALVAAGSAILALAITRQSLWIDEAWTAWFAAHANILSVLHALAWAKGSDAQMPGYLLYMHAWVTLFGRSEPALRFANLPFAVLLLSSLSWVSVVLLKRPYAWTVVILSPFLWFYMDEARPYVLLMAVSSVVAAAVLAYRMEPPRYHRAGPWVAMASFTAAFASYALAAFLAPTVLLFLVVSTQRRWRQLGSDWVRPVLAFFPFIGTISGYYVWTVLRGSGGARGEAGLKNIAYVFYEVFGFAGLGPPRNALRATGGVGLVAYWPWLLFGSIVVLSVLMTVALASHRKLDRDFAVSVAVGFAIAILAYKFAHFRFVGRHLASFFPFAFIALLMNTHMQNEHRRRIVAGAFILLAITWAVSDARLVLLPDYGKEDYRTAAAVAIEHATLSGRPILWAADEAGAYFYGVKTDDDSHRNPVERRTSSHAVNWPVYERAVFASNWTAAAVCEYATRHSDPVLLVLGGKPDLFDRDGAWAWLIRQPGTQAVAVANPNGFKIYELRPEAWRPLDRCVRTEQAYVSSGMSMSSR